MAVGDKGESNPWTAGESGLLYICCCNSRSIGSSRLWRVYDVFLREVELMRLRLCTDGRSVTEWTASALGLGMISGISTGMCVFHGNRVSSRVQSQPAKQK